jgi:hypothetical protein
MLVIIRAFSVLLGILLFGTGGGSLRAATIYTVTNVSSSASVSGSLPWAVYQANHATRGLDYIFFNIPGTGVHVINLPEPLLITDQVVITGKTQPGYSTTPLIVLQGGPYTPTAFTLTNDPYQGTSSTGSTIQGLWIYDFPSSAISILNTSIGNWVQDNWIGFYISNSVIYKTANDFPDPYFYPVGLSIKSMNNTIRNNTVSGLFYGIVVGEDLGSAWSGAIYKTNSIQGNMIGTDPTGMAAYGNMTDGLRLVGGAQQNFIGPNNVFGANLSSACVLLHPSVVGNIVFKNKIGVNSSGNNAIQNGQYGVVLANGANGNAVGGGWGGNVISANPMGGVTLGLDAFPGAPGNWVQNNFIGLNAAGTQAIYGQGVGVNLQSGATGNVVASNVIAGNNSNGVSLMNAVGNGIYYNWIGQNASNTLIPNGGYGIAYMDGAGSNYTVGDIFGSNVAGQIYMVGVEDR